MIYRAFFTPIDQNGAPLGQPIELSQTDILIGRDPEADIVVASAGVSRRHARVKFQSDQYTLEDLNSRNGTFVNDARASGPTVLQSGDRIRLGHSETLLFACTISTADLAATVRSPGIDRSATVLEDVAAQALFDASPPELLVTVAGAPLARYMLVADHVTLGRAEDNDIVIGSQIVSRRHARLERTADGYLLVPLPEAGNPILYDGRPLHEPRLLKHDDKLRIGSLDPGSMVTMTYQHPSTAVMPAATDIDFGESAAITIGRDRSNDIVLETPTVSRFHAVVERMGKRYRVRDLGSANGTFVNSQRVDGEVWIKTDDVIRIGPYRFVVGDNELARYDETGGMRVEAIGLNKWVRRDLNILQNISLVIEPREFVVVVGQSGGGKSTLVDAIAGYRPATDGNVFVNGIDVYRHFDMIRSHIGFVPQKDIIHTELTVFQALDYAARLRMPRDTSRAERHARIAEVLEDLDLIHRQDMPISGLSGGQIKRVSIGVELLTKPGLFFLDEPTSGLDPGTETALMQLMRRLADQGRTILLITHATKNVMLADKVVFLARGGYLAWYGPPDEALAYFAGFRAPRSRRGSEMEFDEIYAILDDPANGSPADWAERFQRHPAYERYIAAPLAGKPLGHSVDARRGRGSVMSRARSDRQISSLRQFAILSSRNLRILARDRFSLALMLAAAPLVGLLHVVLSLVMGREVMDYTDGHMPYVILILFLLGVYGVMVGGLSQMREIVKEADIYRRERLINLRILPYVGSKIWVAGLLSLYQAAAYSLIQYAAFDMPGGLVEFGLFYVTLALVSMAGMMLGLFASSLAPNANAAPLLVILMILPQIVLGGALIPLPQAVSAPTSTRWAMQSLISITGVGSDVAADTCWLLTPEQRQMLTDEDKQAHCRCMGPSMLRENSCYFPGLGAFRTPAIDEPEPQPPPPLREQPGEPELPPRPEQPADQSDSLAMADYFAALEAWEVEASRIQDEYRAELAQYQAEAEVYQARLLEYQTQLGEWRVGRLSAIDPAEQLISRFNRDFGYTFVDKDDPIAFGMQIGLSWAAQVLIISLLFGGILFLQKRKDVI